MCAAFVYGMLATNVIASSPWNHHSPWRRPASVGVATPVSACATIQPPNWVPP